MDLCKLSDRYAGLLAVRLRRRLSDRAGRWLVKMAGDESLRVVLNLA